MKVFRLDAGCVPIVCFGVLTGFLIFAAKWFECGYTIGVGELLPAGTFVLGETVVKIVLEVFHEVSK